MLITLSRYLSVPMKRLKNFASFQDPYPLNGNQLLSQAACQCLPSRLALTNVSSAILS